MIQAFCYDKLLTLPLSDLWHLAESIIDVLYRNNFFWKILGMLSSFILGEEAKNISLGVMVCEESTVH